MSKTFVVATLLLVVILCSFMLVISNGYETGFKAGRCDAIGGQIIDGKCMKTVEVKADAGRP